MRNSDGTGGKYLRSVPVDASMHASSEARRSPAMSLLWRVVGRLALWIVSLLGACGLWSAWVEASLASLPVTPLEPLAQQAGLAWALSGEAKPPEPPLRDGSRVRVEGFLRGEPPLLGSGGHRFALQKLSVTLLERRLTGGRYSSTRRTIAVQTQTPRLWLYASQAGSQRVEVRLPRLWSPDQILLSPIQGRVTDAGTIPNSIFEHLSPAITAPAPEPGQEWELWTIPQSTRVTVAATARLDLGRVLLDIEPGSGSVLSPDPWDEITRGARKAALEQLALGLICLSPLAWKTRKYLSRRRRAAASPGA